MSVKLYVKLFTEKEFNSAKSRDTLLLRCDVCQKKHFKQKNEIQLANKRGHLSHCCSPKCSREQAGRSKGESRKVRTTCDQCGKEFKKYQREIEKTQHNFCSSSCSATYHNSHKKHGTRRSKLEAWLEEQLPSLYPNLEFKFNSKEEINSELDIYIPSLKLAFELNGIFHYEPIYGQDKLNKIQNNDDRKFQACLESSIELCIIDSSGLKYFKPKNAQKYLDLIQSIIEKRREHGGT